jgi:hypothetical protein
VSDEPLFSVTGGIEIGDNKLELLFPMEIESLEAPLLATIVGFGLGRACTGV